MNSFQSILTNAFFLHLTIIHTILRLERHPKSSQTHCLSCISRPPLPLLLLPLSLLTPPPPLPPLLPLPLMDLVISLLLRTLASSPHSLAHAMDATSLPLMYLRSLSLSLSSLFSSLFSLLSSLFSSLFPFLSLS